ncbi:MAG: MetQ/NlpA family ABC transporter substrate-binding protein [Proteobacteria bacterium]|jgi:YaeC family lipoprotein|nr:MetQ/NlpA family ABC transporter substrate-binding protein [Pseudomonadota bacterium]
MSLKKAVSLLILIAIVACQPKKETAANVIRVGVMDGPESDVMETVIPVAKQKFGLEVQLVKFTDYVAPNVALADKSIDVNAFQHQPYLEESVKAKGFNFAVVGNTFLFPIGFYSKKIKKIEELKDGAKIAIPNDPSNEGRTLLILQEKKLIELKDGVGILGTVADISKNPKNLKIVTLDAAQLPRALDDVDVAAINNNYAVPAGLVATRDALMVESISSPYMNLIVSRADNQKDAKVAQLVQSYQSKEVLAKSQEVFQGSAVPGFEVK